MPVARSVKLLPGSPALTWSGSPTFMLFRAAKLAPTTHSSESSRNQFPSTSHQGFVFAAPVTKAPPSGSGKECADQVPMTLTAPERPGEDQFMEAGDQACAGTSRTGAKAMMLLCQKISLILGRSDSGR